MKKCHILAALSGLAITSSIAFAGPCVAQPQRRILTVAASTPGAFGSMCRTSLQLTNLASPFGERAISGTLTFHPAGSSGESGVATLGYTLEPQETQVIPDLLEAMGQRGVGSVDIMPSEGDTYAPLMVARIYNDGGSAGTNGLTEHVVDPAGPIEGGLSYLDPMPTSLAIVTFIAPSDPTNFRWNIGLRTLDIGGGFVVYVLDAAGNPVMEPGSDPDNGGVVHQYGPNYFQQQSASDFVGGPIGANWTVSFVFGEGPMIVYASTIDNRTQDPSIDFGLPHEPIPMDCF